MKEDKGSTYQGLASSSGCTDTVEALLFHDDLDEENATWRTTADVENGVNLITMHCGWD